MEVACFVWKCGLKLPLHRKVYLDSWQYTKAEQSHWLFPIFNVSQVESQVLLQDDKNATLLYFYWAGGPTLEQVAQKGCAVSIHGDWTWLWETCSSWLCFELWGRTRWLPEVPANTNHAVILWLLSRCTYRSPPAVFRPRLTFVLKWMVTCSLYTYIHG